MSGASRRKPLPHGSNAGYHGHMRRKEQPCESCREAHREYNRQHDHRAVRQVPCGTERGYHAHLSAKERTCRACKDAHAIHRRSQRNEAGETNTPLDQPIRQMRTLVRLPLELFVDLYWTASPKALAALDQLLGADKVDDLVKQAEGN